MPSTKQQRARRQTAPSGPPRKPTVNETQSSMEQSSGFLQWSIPNWSNELEFSQWLNGVKEDVVEESYDQYQYV